MDHTALMVFLSLCSSGLWAEHTAVVSEVRLVGGNSSCSGRLEMKDQEGWKEVKDRELTWNLMSAAEVCRQLDCGSVESLRRDRMSSVSITCSDSVRLVDGTGLCSGRLEVKSHQLNQSWSSVSEDGFDQQDAEVVCRELDCGPPSVLQGALYGETEAPTWSTEFQCEGTEAALLDCDGSVRKYSGKAVGLTCSEPVDSIRLVGGGSRCNGRLEIKYRGEWKEVDGYYFWTLSFAGEVCKQLDCGSRVSIRRRKKDDDEEVWRLNEDCDGSSLTKCVAGITDSSRSTEVTCSDSVRLVDGPHLCSGRLEVNFNQSWSSVCEADFDQQDAEVVCRELDCGPPSVLQGALYGEVEAPVWSREFQCEGTEAALLDCRSSGSARNTCSPGKAVGLTCSDQDLRLVGEASRCAGTLEMFHQKQWRPAAVPDGWDRSSAAAVCAQLGCGSVVSTRGLEESSDRSVWWISSYCLQRTSVLRDCVIDDYDPATKDSLEVICSDLLVEPHIFLPSSTDGVSNAIKQGSEVPIGSDFSIMCSIKPQYQGGSFQLIFSSSNSAQNYTLPAVNHSAHFLFSAADHAHQGTYSCVYHVYVFSHNFSSPSQPLSVTVSVSGSLTALIIRLVVVLLGLMGSILVLYFYFKASSSQKWGQKKKPHVDGSRAEGCREEETAASRIFSSHSDEETVTCFRQLVAPHGDMREPEVI